MTDCVLWQGYIKPNGYGQVHRPRNDLGKTTAYAHRIAWEVVHGPIAEGAEVHHICRNRACVNVDHLMVVSSAEHHRLHDAERKTCNSGRHPWTPDNVYMTKASRSCRACRREAMKRYRARLRKAAA